MSNNERPNVKFNEFLLIKKDGKSFRSVEIESDCWNHFDLMKGETLSFSYDESTTNFEDFITLNGHKMLRCFFTLENEHSMEDRNGKHWFLTNVIFQELGIDGKPTKQFNVSLNEEGQIESMPLKAINYIEYDEILKNDHHINWTPSGDKESLDRLDEKSLKKIRESIQSDLKSFVPAEPELKDSLFEQLGIENARDLQALMILSMLGIHK